MFKMKILAGFAILLFLAQNAFAQVGFTQEGKASYYADDFEGRTTASGERYSHKKATCAHMSIPFGALVKITNLDNNLTAIVRVNDRGPFASDRIIDVSQSVAQRLGMMGKKLSPVKIEVVDSNGYSMQKNETIHQDVPKVDSLKKEEQKPTQEKIDLPTKTDKNLEIIKQPTCELFNLSIEPANLNGFSVQIGSYKELVNVLRIAADIQKSTKNNTRIQVVTNNGEKFYKLMVGSFKNRKDAENLKEKISKIYKDCFIVELKE
jgi:rare lipoprotein A